MSKREEVDSFSESSKGSNDCDDFDTFLWGCTLTRQNPIARWGDQMDDSGNPAFYQEHSLSIRQAVLGYDAVEGERNVVAVGSEGYDKEKLEFPILCLSRNHQETCAMTMDLHWPAVFRLSQGSGPITLTGEHHVTYAGDEDEDEEEDEMASASSSFSSEWSAQPMTKTKKEKKKTSPRMGNRLSPSSTKDSSKIRVKKTRRSESSDRPDRKQRPLKSESRCRSSIETGTKKAVKKKVSEGKHVVKRMKTKRMQVKVEPE